MCSCWHNGGRRSRWGTTETCLPILPVVYPAPRCCRKTETNPCLSKSELKDDGTCVDPTHTIVYYDTQNKMPYIDYNQKINDIPCSSITFAEDPHDDTDNGARLLGGWGQGKLTEYWCTQDQISIHGQVCSYTGLTDGECNPVPRYEKDQNSNKIIKTATITPSGVSSNK